MALTIEQQVVNSLERNSRGVLITLTAARPREAIKDAWNNFRTWLAVRNGGITPEHIVAHEYHGFARTAVCAAVFMDGIGDAEVRTAAKDAGFDSLFLMHPLKRLFGRKKQVLKFFEGCEMGVA